MVIIMFMATLCVSMYNAIVNACTVSADLCIPNFGTDTQNKGSKVIPGWSDSVEPAGNKAIFWHKMDRQLSSSIRSNF